MQCCWSSHSRVTVKPNLAAVASSLPTTLSLTTSLYHMQADAPHRYLPGGDLYRAVPVYRSANGLEHAINSTEPFQLGCSCSQRGSSCSRSVDCTCPEDAEANEEGVCLDSVCTACADDPSTCLTHPGCECRRNSMVAGTEYFGCGPQCHGDQPVDLDVCQSYVRLSTTALFVTPF